MSTGPAPALSDTAIAAYARQAGFTGDNLTTIVAVILAESGGDPDEVGDESLVNATYGPSIGLAQVRSLRAELGTGRPRDAARLTDPAFNLRSAWSISSGGTNFRPWTQWVNRKYQQFMIRAAAAAEGVNLGGGGGLAGGGGDAGAGLVDSLTGGLARLVLVGLALAGGVALVAAGAWRSTPAPARRVVKSAAGAAAGGPVGAAAGGVL